MSNRKEELLDELKVIQNKNLEKEVEGLGYTPPPIKSDKGMHVFVIVGDFAIKFFVAIAVSAAFIYIVYTGNADAMKPGLIDLPTKGSGNFQLLSVVGPLFGMVMSYYFGKSKAGANGE